MPVFGFDFGTTNSLASVVVGDRVVTFLESGQPIPSVVSYEGGKVEVGRKARDRLSGAGLGVQGSTVRSPKSLLGQDELVIDGVRRDPVEIVKHVLDYVRKFVLHAFTTAPCAQRARLRCALPRRAVRLRWRRSLWTPLSHPGRPSECCSARCAPPRTPARPWQLKVVAAAAFPKFLLTLNTWAVVTTSTP